MSFAEWAVNHVDGDKRSTRFRRIDDNKHEYELWERDDNVDMSIVITGLPNNFVIIDPEGVGQWNWFEELGRWTARCDFLIIGNSNEIPFAFFIELKKDMGPNNLKRARNQLRWSRSLLHYALSIHNIFESSATQESDLIVKYLMVGQNPDARLAILPTSIDEAIQSYSCIHKGISINYTIADKFTLAQLLNLD